MDLATLIGVLLALGAVFGSDVMEGGNPAALIAPPAIVLVLFGTMGASMASGMMRDYTGGLKGIKEALLSKKKDASASIEALVGFADKARREGLLALEEAAKAVEDPFLKKGIGLAVDGTDPEELRDILEAEINHRKGVNKQKAKFFADMGAFSPTFGIIGTVMGLVKVLENLSEPDKLGPLISGAFIATLWGVLLANAVWLPIGKKLARIAEEDAHLMELVLEGILSVQAGANPRVLEEKLVSFAGGAKEGKDKGKDKDEKKAA